MRTTKITCWHLTYSADGRFPLFPDESSRRRAVRALARVAGRNMVLFCIVDEHVHVVLLTRGKKEASRLGVGILFALRPLASTHIEPPYPRPVTTRSHLNWLLRYVLTQPTHHGLQVSPALWSGSCFQDLSGARVLDGLELRTAEAMPRLQSREVLSMVGLPAGQELRPATNTEVREAGAARVVAAVASALGVGPELAGNTPVIVRARRAAIAVCDQAGIARTEACWALGLSPRTARHLATKPGDPVASRAARVRLRLELVAASPGERGQASGKKSRGSQEPPDFLPP
jgi:hypothetical protein